MQSQRNHPGVTNEFRTAENEEQEYLELQAKLSQLKTALSRQRRMRVHNEKTNGITKDRYNRAEELVTEMRSDLKSLKSRLLDELTELDINEDAAESILSDFYRQSIAGPVDAGDASPLKRSRRRISRGVQEDVDQESVDNDASGDEAEVTKKQRLTQ